MLANNLRMNESFNVSNNYRFKTYYLNFNYLCIKYVIKLDNKIHVINYYEIDRNLEDKHTIYHI